MYVIVWKGASGPKLSVNSLKSMFETDVNMKYEGNKQQISQCCSIFFY